MVSCLAPYIRLKAFQELPKERPTIHVAYGADMFQRTMGTRGLCKVRGSPLAWEHGMQYRFNVPFSSSIQEGALPAAFAWHNLFKTTYIFVIVCPRALEHIDQCIDRSNRRELGGGDFLVNPPFKISKPFLQNPNYHGHGSRGCDGKGVATQSNV
eukprot:1140086-Pelagomonas_calceolata.AAC.9